MQGYTVTIEAACPAGFVTRSRVARIAEELAQYEGSVRVAADGRLDATLPVPEAHAVGHAFVLAVARFGEAAAFAGFGALPLERVEVVRAADAAEEAALPRAAAGSR
jgi:hypothetical protein